MHVDIGPSFTRRPQGRPAYLRPFVAGLIVGVLAMSVAWTAVEVRAAFRHAMDDENDGQALFRASVDICDFLEDHDGRWPSGWNDLDAERRRRHPGGAAEESADERARVAIDWTVDPARLAPLGERADGETDVQVVWLRSCADGRRTFATPNLTVVGFLRDRLAAPRPASRP